MSPVAMVQMALVLCLKAHPAICTMPKALVFEQPPTLMECTLFGQQAGADYLNKHPALAKRYFVQRVECSFSGIRDGHVG